MNIGIVGLGLIGGSLARTILKKTLDNVYAFDISERALKDGKLLGAYNNLLTKDKVKELDVLFLSVYPSAVIQELENYCPLLKDGALVVDLCGVKRNITDKMKEMKRKYPNLNFIGAHPMAGREFSGVNHSTASLFERASMIICPIDSNLKVLSFFKEYCLKLGFSKVVVSTPKNHDKIIAFTSQLAHVISSAYIKSDTAKEHLGFTAGSVRDMTRVARLSSNMWAELMSENSDFLVKEIDTLIENLIEYKLALESKNNKRLKEILEDGNQKKLAYEKLKRMENDE